MYLSHSATTVYIYTTHRQMNQRKSANNWNQIKQPWNVNWIQILRNCNTFIIFSKLAKVVKYLSQTCFNSIDFLQLSVVIERKKSRPSVLSLDADRCGDCANVTTKPNRYQFCTQQNYNKKIFRFWAFSCRSFDDNEKTSSRAALVCILLSRESTLIAINSTTLIYHRMSGGNYCSGEFATGFILVCCYGCGYGTQKYPSKMCEKCHREVAFSIKNCRIISRMFFFVRKNRLRRLQLQAISRRTFTRNMSVHNDSITWFKLIYPSYIHTFTRRIQSL